MNIRIFSFEKIFGGAELLYSFENRIQIFFYVFVSQSSTEYLFLAQVLSIL